MLDVVRGEEFFQEIAGMQKIFMVFIASTKTSTIKGISIAGPTPLATLYTPALDVEYLVAGKPLTMDVIPVTPDGIPTPAMVTKAVLSLTGTPILVVDAGSYVAPRIPHIVLPSRRVGDRVDTGKALMPGTARLLFQEARLLGERIGARGLAFFVGESMPGGTTTAMAIMEALGYRARGRVSSASPENPHSLKTRIVETGLEKAGIRRSTNVDVYEAVDAVGDPLHISIAGFAAGAVERGAKIILSGGTQMCAVLAILSKLGLLDRESIGVATTRWILEDPSSDFIGLLTETGGGIPLAVARISLAEAPYPGLRRYEEGYVKEGVGMGGALVLAGLEGRSDRELLDAIYREYERITGHADAKS